MSARDWAEVIALGLNIIVCFALFIARLQVKNWFLEQKEATQAALDAHNEDPGAHNNHSIAVGLEEKFNQMIEKVSALTTQLAVLNERLESQNKRRR